MEIDWDINPTTLRLMQTMREFHRLSWGERPVAGCKPSEIRVLFCIRNGKMKVSEISKLLNVTSPSVTQLLKGLEAHRLIERHIDPVDRRAVGIKLTEEGDEVIRQAMEGYKRSLDGLVEYLGQDKSEQLVELITKVMRYFSEQQEVTMRSGQEASMRQFQGNGDEKA